MLSAISAIQERNLEQKVLREISQNPGQGHQEIGQSQVQGHEQIQQEQVQYKEQGQWSQGQGSSQGHEEIGEKFHPNINYIHEITHGTNGPETNEIEIKPQNVPWNSPGNQMYQDTPQAPYEIVPNSPVQIEITTEPGNPSLSKYEDVSPPAGTKYETLQNSPSPYLQYREGYDPPSNSYVPGSGYDVGSAPPDVGQYEASHAPAIQYKTSHAPASEYENSHVPSAHYEANHAPVGQYEASHAPQTEYEANHAPSVQYEANHAPSAQYEAGHAPQTEFEANHASSGHYEANHAPSAQYEASHASSSHYKRDHAQLGQYEPSYTSSVKYESSHVPQGEYKFTQATRRQFQDGYSYPVQRDGHYTDSLQNIREDTKLSNSEMFAYKPPSPSNISPSSLMYQKDDYGWQSGREPNIPIHYSSDTHRSTQPIGYPEQKTNFHGIQYHGAQSSQAMPDIVQTHTCRHCHQFPCTCRESPVQPEVAAESEGKLKCSKCFRSFSYAARWKQHESQCASKGHEGQRSPSAEQGQEKVIKVSDLECSDCFKKFKSIRWLQWHRVNKCSARYRSRSLEGQLQPSGYAKVGHQKIGQDSPLGFSKEMPLFQPSGKMYDQSDAPQGGMLSKMPKRRGRKPRFISGIPPTLEAKPLDHGMDSPTSEFPARLQGDRYICGICHASFSFDTNLTRHQRKIHGKPFVRKPRAGSIGQKDCAMYTDIPETNLESDVGFQAAGFHGESDSPNRPEGEYGGAREGTTPAGPHRREFTEYTKVTQYKEVNQYIKVNQYFEAPFQHAP